MSFLPEPLESVRPTILTRVSPLTRLLVATVWLGVAFITLEPLVPAILLGAAIVALVTISGVPLRRLPRRLAPLILSAAGLALLTVLVHPSAADPTVETLWTIGPVRVTVPAMVVGLALMLRLAVIAVSSVLVFAPSDPTRFADALVQQWHVSHRIAYGSLAALRIAPLLAADWAATGAVRRLRGLESGSPIGRIRGFVSRLFVLLVAAIRRGGRMALAMDARGFDGGHARTSYRIIRAGPLDAAVLIVGLLIAAGALVIGRG